MRRRNLFFSILALIVLSAASVAGDDKQTMTGAEIIGKHLAAIGGKEALAKFKSRVAIGTIKKENEAAAQLVIMSEAPNRVSAIYQFVDYDWRLIYDGSKAIFRPTMTRAAAPVQQKYMDILATGTMFNGIALYNILSEGESSELKFESKGTKKVKGRPAYVVEVKRAKGNALRLYFDAETFMWVRTDYGRVNITKDMGTFTNAITSKDEETTVDFYIETSDFREVDGVKLPFKFEQVATFPILRQKNIGTVVGTINEYRHNVPIDPKMFQ